MGDWVKVWENKEYGRMIIWENEYGRMIVWENEYGRMIVWENDSMEE